jgi:transposase InsO family protein
MYISRSGYYKWIKTKDLLNQYEFNRSELFQLIKEAHKDKPSYGYHRINWWIQDKIGWYVSDNLIHKCCKYLGIKSKAKHYKYKKPGEESVKFPNLINGNWNTIRPLELVVTDTTTIWFKKVPYDWTYYVDVFNNEIIGSDISSYRHGSNPLNHKKALNTMIETKIKRGYKNLDTIFHSDQGSIYSSAAFFNAHKDYTIIRSMSRAGTPTDNPIIESINGWLKKEIFIDFDVNSYNNVKDFINDVIYYFNNKRPAYALNYKTPIQYRTELGF